MGQIVRNTRAGRFYSRGCVLLLRALRKLNWSVNELARRLGTDSGVVSRWLRGDRRPRASFAIEIEALFEDHDIELPRDAWLKSPPKNFTLKTGTDG